jgi:hypothetical protein
VASPSNACDVVVVSGLLADVLGEQNDAIIDDDFATLTARIYGDAADDTGVMKSNCYEVGLDAKLKT